MFPNRLLCSGKDCFVLKKIVVFSKRLLCSEKDCCVSEQKLSCVLPLWATVQMGILCAHARNAWNNLSSAPFVIFERAAVGF